MTLTEFLLARIAEDEERAHLSGGKVAWITYRNDDGSMRYTTVAADAGDDWVAEGQIVQDAANVQEFYDAARVLAECEAKRRIVEKATEAMCGADAWTHERLKTDARSPLPEWARRDAYIEVLRDIATAWADHPDFREEWRS